MLFILDTYEHTLSCVFECVVSWMSLYNISKQTSVIFNSWSFFFDFCYTKLMTVYKRSNCTDVFFDFVCTIFIHRCLILKQVCKSHFLNAFEITQSLRDNKVSEGEAHLAVVLSTWHIFLRPSTICLWIQIWQALLERSPTCCHIQIWGNTFVDFTWSCKSTW